MPKIPLYYSIVIGILAQYTITALAQYTDYNTINIAEEIYTACIGKQDGAPCSYMYNQVPGKGICQTRSGNYIGFEMNKAETDYITKKHKNPRLCIGYNP